MAGMKSPLEPCSVIVGLGRYRATVMPKHGPRMLSVISFKFCWMHKGVRDVIASGRLLQARQLRPSVMSFDGEVPLEGWWRGIRYFFGSSGLWNHSNYFSHQSKKANKSVHAIQIHEIFWSNLDLWIYRFMICYLKNHTVFWTWQIKTHSKLFFTLLAYLILRWFFP